VFTPAEPVDEEIRRVARERLGDAIERLDAVLAGEDTDVEDAVHQTRKRCKEMRGLARLIRPALGKEFREFDRTVRSAARELSSMRDAHALLGTIDALLATRQAHSDPGLRAVREQQATLAAAASASATAGEGAERIRAARSLLVEALDRSQRWHLADAQGAVVAGLTATYRRGRRELRHCRRHPDDHTVHEWRKVVKHLWYQLRLLREAAPSVLGPLVDLLDDLADALGDDHDLAVFVEQLDATPERFGEPAAVAHACELARAEQTLLRDGALRAGATIYAERPTAFATRIEAYWSVAVEHGPERPVGSIETLAERNDEPAVRDHPFERERTFLVDRLPDDLGPGVELRQGYLAIGNRASVRVRDAGDCTLTVKAGTGAERLELEWPIRRAEFDAAWPHTAGQRVVKTRHRLALDGHDVEIDVFGGELDGLVLAEVEFGSMADLEAFEPAAWFGDEVTDDGRYSNAALARDGLP
jgi:CYTH domain-containing protein/CHAD domain-containing protein